MPESAADHADTPDSPDPGDPDPGDPAALARQWQTEGWVLVDQLIPRDEIDAALAELKDAAPEVPTGPQRRPDQHVAAKSFRAAQFDGTTLFPYPRSPRLNRLFVHPHLIAFAEAALDETDLRIYQSRVWSKYGGHTNYEQPLHRDGNHSLIPIRNVARWWHLECFLYLNDVDETNGAPMLVPGAAASGSIGRGRAMDPDDAPTLYDREVAAPGPAGSLLAYRSNVWHRGTDMADGTERHIVAVSFRPEAAPWISFDAHGPLVNSPDFVEFVAGRSPRELALFGVPLPGHEYWDHDVIDAMAKVYPGLDVSPWNEALARCD